MLHARAECVYIDERCVIAERLSIAKRLSVAERFSIVERLSVAERFSIAERLGVAERFAIATSVHDAGADGHAERFAVVHSDAVQLRVADPNAQPDSNALTNACTAAIRPGGGILGIQCHIALPSGD